MWPKGDEENGKQNRSIKGTCECDVPNAELYEFKGNLKVGGKSYALSGN